MPCCYFHTNLQHSAKRKGKYDDWSLKLPSLEDSCGIQIALAEVLNALASSRIEPRRAGLLLYGVQIAAQITARPRDPNLSPVRDICEERDDAFLGPEKTVCEPPEDCRDSPRREQCNDRKEEKEQKDYPDECESAHSRSNADKNEDDAGAPGLDAGVPTDKSSSVGWLKRSEGSAFVSHSLPHKSLSS
jgi:hypothetical protein